jgi:hypothetical protein
VFQFFFRIIELRHHNDLSSPTYCTVCPHRYCMVVTEEHTLVFGWKNKHCLQDIHKCPMKSDYTKHAYFCKYFLKPFIPLFSTNYLSAQIFFLAKAVFNAAILCVCRSQCPCGLRRGSASTRLLGLWVRIPPGHGCLSLVSVVCCHVEVSATSWSLVQRTPTECVVSKNCDREASKNEAA